MRALHLLIALLTLAAATPVAPAAQPPASGDPDAGEVRLELLGVGVGSTARAGGWTALRLRVQDRAAEPRELLVRVEFTDQDGDRPSYDALVPAAGPGGRELWIPVRLPPDFTESSGVSLRAFVASRESEPGGLPSAGALVGSDFVPVSSEQASDRSSTIIKPTDGLIAVVGSRAMGLEQYAVTQRGDDWSPLGHERTQIVADLAPTDLPDHFAGLMPFEAIIWSDEPPGDLGLDRPAALADWIRRGGHLVIVVPGVGQTWSIPEANPLGRLGLLPDAELIRREPAAGAARPAWADLVGLPADASPPGLVIHEFRPRVRDARTAVPILVDAQGRVLAVRRLVGLGMVTMIGIDLTDRSLERLGMPRADTLWHRVLGKRGPLLRESEIEVLERSRGWTLANRQPMWFDADFPTLIAKTGRSAAGLLLGFVLFAIYWIIAGPGGYALLKKRGLARHAWVAFGIVAVVFTVLAWSGALAIRPKTVSAQHITVIDHVYRQPVQRTRTWMSLLIPWYGDATLSVGRASDDSTTLIAPWQPRSVPDTLGRFPDVRPYRLDARRPDRVTFPARATVKQFVVDHAGRPSDEWVMPTPVDANGRAGPATLAIDPEGGASGRLRHGLPAPLEEALIIVCRGVSDPTGEDAAERPIRARAYKVNSWAPGEILDLSRARSRDGSFEAYLDGLVPQGSAPDFGSFAQETAAPGDAADHFVALSLFSQLPPPQFRTTGSLFPLARRSEGHGLDLSHWLTQPCIIVIGHVGLSEPVASPTPMFIGSSDEPIESLGRTLVRWVYPVPPAEPAP